MSVAASADHLRPGSSLTGPYIGLVPYDEGDAAFFFGRSRETALVAANFRGARLTVVYGPSGVGKTSLLMAGVVHTMREEAQSSGDPGYAVCTFRSWRDAPLPGLRETCRAALQTLAGDEPMADVEPGATLAEALKLWTEHAGTLYLVLDQFEEYLQYHPVRDSDDLQPGFEAEFAELVDDPSIAVHVLLSIREDAWAGLDRFEGHVPGVFGNYLRIDHLDVEAAREAITGPIEAWNEGHTDEDGTYEIEPALVDAVIGAATTSAGLVGAIGAGTSPTREKDRIEAPFLQLVMERVWRATIEAGRRRLTLEQLEQLGGALQIVERHLDDALGRLSRTEQHVVSDCFAFLVSRSRTKVAHPAADLADWTGRSEEEVARVLDTLCSGEGGRILRRTSEASSGGRGPTYELYHDVLAEPVLTWRRTHQQAADRWRMVRIGAAVALIAAVLAAITILVIAQRQATETARRNTKWLAAASAAQSLASINLAESLRLSLVATEAVDSSQARSAMTLGLETARQTGVRRLLTGHTGAVNSIDFGGSAGAFVSGGADGTVRLWNVDAGKPTVPVFVGHIGPVDSVAMSADGHVVVSGGEDGSVRLWRRGSLTESRVLFRTPDGRPVLGVDVSPTGDLVAIGGADGVVRLADVRRNSLYETVGTRNKGPVTQVAFDPDGRMLASVDTDGVVQLSVVHRLRRRMPSRACIGSERVSSIAFSADGRLLACGDDRGGAQLWKIRGSRWQRGRMTSKAGFIQSLALSPDGRWLAAVGESGSVLLWDIGRHGRASSAQLLTAGTEPLRSVEFSPNGRFLAGSGLDGTIFFWSLRRREPTVVPGTAGSRAVSVSSAAFSPTAPVLVAASFDGAVRLWNVGARVEGGARFTAARRDEPAAFAFSRNGRVLAVERDDETVEVWSVQRHDLLGTFRSGDRVGFITVLALSPRGTTLAIAGDKGFVRLVRLRRDTPAGWLRGSSHGSVTGVVFSPSGRALATSGRDGNVRLWAIGSKPTLVARMGQYEGGIASVALSPDGQTLAGGGADGTIRLWHLSRGEPRPLTSLAGHTRGIDSLAFSTDSRTLVSGSEDGTVRLWDTQEQLELGAPLDMHNGAVYSVSISSNGRTLAAAYQAGPVRIWRGILWTNGANLRSQVCALVPSDLTDALWRTLVPGIEQNQQC
jgi:WD40 repeat protein